jgi:tetratricopeptide (TPR) repeat protein
MATLSRPQRTRSFQTDGWRAFPEANRTGRRYGPPFLVLFLLAAMFRFSISSWGAVEWEEAQRLYLHGQYQSCITNVQAAIEEGAYGEDWRLLLTDSLLAVGQYSNALEVVEKALDRYTTSIRLRLQARTVYLYNGLPDRARAVLNQVNYLGGSRIWAYRDPPNLVALGRAALLLGADARRVLEQFFDRAKLQDAKLRDVYLASGQLALDKEDFQLAAKVFAEGVKRLPDDPDLHFGLARAFASSDRRQMLQSLDAAMDLNTNHVPSYLLLADHLVDGEEYAAAAENLAAVLKVNPWQPQAWAYRAVIAQLEAQPEDAARARAKALKYWTNNPAVDHLIGRKLSQKYRFQEGARCQRRALEFDPDYLPAKIQLAQDLMRLGEEEEGWKLAGQVHEEDGYNVPAFNLVTLKESLQKFETLTNRDFILRMSPREAALYGGQALDLLGEAKEKLSQKYGLTLTRPTIVEVFPEQKDFGVRTFGMPDNPGFLGVCFGSVITANSPASQGGHPNNWRAVLWHEFCHVITLQLTRNKMPRWLSEGISVYEERQANPAWGQIMNPRYREMILGGELTPMSDLSAAFLAPKSDFHLQFAYYESALAVEFLVGHFGLDNLRAILRDLGEDVEINEAIPRHTAPMEKMEADFESFARQRAEALGPGLDWEKPDPDRPDEETPEWLEKHSKNYFVLMKRAGRLLEEEKWNEAKAPLHTLLDLYPEQRGPNNAYPMLALALRKLNETAEERRVLNRWSLLDGDALEAYQRLMEIAAEDKDWKAVAQNANRYLAVNPLVPQPYRYLAQASEKLGDAPSAIRAWKTLLNLDEPDPAELHFHLATLMHQSQDAGARRQVLQALEEAPRFRAAHRLLLKIDEEDGPASRPDTKPAVKPVAP